MNPTTAPTVTDWRIVALSGTTADGREIKAADLEDMAAAYDPKTYAARINLEHLRFLFPHPEVSGFGDVVALKTAAAADGKTALLAKLSVNGNLQALWDADQKVYSSIEIAKPFADTGKAYLAGLAVTDSPASLGTDRHFSLTGTAAAAAAQNIHFSEYIAMTNATEAKTKPEDKKIGLFATLLNALSAKTEDPAQDAEEAEGQTETEASEIRRLSADLAEAQAELQTAAQFSAALLEELKELKQDFADLKKQLENSPVSGYRKAHTGAADTVKSEF